MMMQALVVIMAVWGAVAQKIAIVGAGIGAASTALHLRELVDEDIDIDV
jgi:glycine/D-amino acid oxidase-like deaminating enzyme